MGGFFQNRYTVNFYESDIKIYFQKLGGWNRGGVGCFHATVKYTVTDRKQLESSRDAPRNNQYKTLDVVLNGDGRNKAVQKVRRQLAQLEYILNISCPNPTQKRPAHKQKKRHSRAADAGSYYRR